MLQHCLAWDLHFIFFVSPFTRVCAVCSCKTSSAPVILVEDNSIFCFTHILGAQKIINYQFSVLLSKFSLTVDQRFHFTPKSCVQMRSRWAGRGQQNWNAISTLVLVLVSCVCRCSKEIFICLISDTRKFWPEPGLIWGELVSSLWWVCFLQLIRIRRSNLHKTRFETPTTRHQQLSFSMKKLDCSSSSSLKAHTLVFWRCFLEAIGF